MGAFGVAVSRAREIRDKHKEKGGGVVASADGGRGLGQSMEGREYLQLFTTEDLL